ncbi:EAL domain protein (plasmid) [Burkholderia thailandensis 34]|nr:EAL domain protein [Burkholderia thailandensis 34]PNE73153.1 hypothetical protein A8H37_13620 [Burkholderia thailandensis]
MRTRSVLLIEVTNRSVLIDNFGRALVEEIDIELSERARHLCGPSVGVRAIRGGRLVISGSVAEVPHDGRRVACVGTEEWLLKLSGKSAPHSRVGWLAELRARWICGNAETLIDAGRSKAPLGAATRADFAIASAVLRAIDTDAISLEVSPVHNPSDHCDVLYFDCSMLIGSLGGFQCSLDAYSSCFARMGLVPYIECHMFSLVLDLLEHSTNLYVGVNFSGQTIADEFWSEEVINRLCGSPDLAKRLIVEVAENIDFDSENARKFLKQLKALGCRIAIDEYGLAYGCDVNTTIPEPDIVKIAPAFVAEACRDSAALGKFRRLLKLGASIAREVVVMGVKGDDEMSVVRVVSANWVQRF